MKVIDNVYVIPGVTANPYVLVGDDGLTLIDTGLPHSERTILRYLMGKGWLASDIKRILITHADIDHYGCLAALRNASGARTFASAIEAQAIARGQSSRPIDRNGNTALLRLSIALFSRLMKATPVQVGDILQEGQILPVLGGLQVLETPGHSPNHLSFFVSSLKVLFCGDSMRSDDKGLHGSRSRNDWNHEIAKASVGKQAGLGTEIVCPGHGPVIRQAGLAFPVN
jgi:glyoxylase-like metal-dependent hydrolase (beta-lactamase superfamily II)